MNTLQSLLVRLLPARWAEDMEAESRSWMIRCPGCGFEQSVWDIGGIRWKAASVNKMVLRHCPDCKERGWHSVYRRSE
jgi:hypothetical protein